MTWMVSSIMFGGSLEIFLPVFLRALRGKEVDRPSVHRLTVESDTTLHGVARILTGAAGQNDKNIDQNHSREAMPQVPGSNHG
jgi:hypothetical protein